jgi:hypothetical protein
LTYKEPRRGTLAFAQSPPREELTTATTATIAPPLSPPRGSTDALDDDEMARLAEMAEQYLDNEEEGL